MGHLPSLWGVLVGVGVFFQVLVWYNRPLPTPIHFLSVFDGSDGTIWDLELVFLCVGRVISKK